MSVLNTYIVSDDQLYLNGLDAYILCTVHEQDLVVVILFGCCTTRNVMPVHVCIAHNQSSITHLED